MASGGAGGRRRHDSRRGHGAGQQGCRSAADVRRHDQADRQSSGARAGRSGWPHGHRSVRAGEPEPGPQGRRRGFPGAP